MEYSQIALIAFILLVVFCGAQISKLLALFNPKRTSLETIKTVVSASKPVEVPHESSVVARQVKKAVAPAKKSVPVKKNVSIKTSTSAKKTAAKKTAIKKKNTKK